MAPAGKIAARSFIEIPITLVAPPSAILISSPSVLTSRLCGELPFAPGVPPSRVVAASSTDVMTLPLGRSYHSLAIMPLVAGVEPVMNVA